jgi:hypothetical protein
LAKNAKSRERNAAKRAAKEAGTGGDVVVSPVLRSSFHGKSDAAGLDFRWKMALLCRKLKILFVFFSACTFPWKI